jgi:bifunctional ADP-heptose synthase (sugar kinase/adenylyltransferase)
VDTRNKILTIGEALELAPPVAVVTGTFDILRAAHARRLEGVRGRAGDSRILAVVLPSPRGWLPARARAEMAAAMRVIDYVVAANREELGRLADALRPAVFESLEAEDDRLARQLVEHVHR